MDIKKRFRKLYRRLFSRKLTYRLADKVLKSYKIKVQIDPDQEKAIARRMVRIIRLKFGKPAFQRMRCLEGFDEISANFLEMFSLVNKQPPQAHPLYALAMVKKTIEDRIKDYESYER